jgi:hypothetical protein
MERCIKENGDVFVNLSICSNYIFKNEIYLISVLTSGNMCFGQVSGKSDCILCFNILLHCVVFAGNCQTDQDTTFMLKERNYYAAC